MCEKHTFRQRFLAAVRAGELGTRGDRGVVLTLKEFRAFFPDINDNYARSFLPAATIETGQVRMEHTKYVIRLEAGVYLVHPDVFKASGMETRKTGEFV